MQFDASNPYHRYMLHYESEHQLSIAELIGMGSVDAHTAAIVWSLLEHRASYIISGPTDPTPGVGKTTTLNALLPFYPDGTLMVYTLGMYETFDFLDDLAPHTATILANEVSDHLRIYMWGARARKFLTLPQMGHAIATSCHADTIDDVLHMLSYDLRIPNRDQHNLQIIVNIGLTGDSWPQHRRWLTTHFIAPSAKTTRQKTGDDGEDFPKMKPMLISAWNPTTDTFTSPSAGIMKVMSAWAGISKDEFAADIAKRRSFLEEHSMQGTEIDEFYQAIAGYRQQS